MAGGDTVTPAQPAGGTRPPTVEPTPYVNGRVIATASDVDAFANDRTEFPNGPGFHIYGLCPCCGHHTSSVCATDFLAQDEDTTSAPDRTDQANQSKPTYAWDGKVKERTHLRGNTPRAKRGAGGNPLGGDAGRRNMKTMITVMRCACTHNHVAPSGTASPPAPGAFGCGAEWLVRVEYPDGAGGADLMPVGAVEAALCWPAADAAAAEVPNALVTAQASAKNWAAGLAAILTVLGVGTLISNLSTVRSLDTALQVLFGFAAAIAVLTNGLMIYATTIASYGSFRSGDALRPSDLRNADLDPLLQARASEQQLRRAILWTAVAVIAALTAIAILLYGHSQPMPTTPAAAS